MSGIKVNGISKRIGGRPSLSSGSSVLKSLSINLLVGAVMMYVGIGIGIRVELQDCTKECAKQTVDTLRQSVAGDISGSGGGSDNGEGERILKSEAAVECAKLVENACGKSSSKAKTETSKSTGTRFPYNVKLFATGLAQVDRETFAKRFDVGVPLDKSEHGNDRLLILYNDPMGLPNDEDLARAIGGSGEVPLIENIEQATENCDVLDLTLIQSKTKRQCFAMMGQYQSFHIQKFMRLPEQAGQRLDPKAPLRLVNRGAQPTGRLSAKPPKKEQTLTYWNTLKTYLDTLESVLAELQPLAEKVARQNTVIVMVCNHGQSELLMNFVCSARSRNLDLSAILVFATDEETKELAIGLGLTAFFDKINYGSAPKTAARSYGDRAFTAMMMAKVYCVQMISFLGYDLLFQDVDVVWFKDPLEYFHDEHSPSHGFDVYFQDDGSRGIFYAPFSANTGFYYVRANDRTRNFFNSLLMSGDLVVSTKSHQIALVALLSEHSSLHGMKTKVLSRDTDEFPGGHAFHYRKDFMRQLFKGEVDPYIFHMSWTLNKDNKQKFFRQIGEWYLKDTCVASTVTNIIGEDKEIGSGDLVEPCCSTEALFACFYSDKPSKFPCKNSPQIDKGGKPFWK